MEGITYCVDREPRLPPGFRFHPTDEELITHYLARKIARTVEYGSFWDGAITEVDLNKYEPWELPGMAQMGEKEWYFYSLKDRKYPSGLRTNRATQSGYWKATGKDKEVNTSALPKQLVGMKKTLVFYKGRAPKGLKTSWVMHEYRMEGEPRVAMAGGALTKLKGTKKEWVVCRVFHKSLRGKRVSLAELQRGGAAAHFNDFRSVTPPRPTGSFTATDSIPAEPPRYLASPIGAASMTVIPSNFTDAKLAALADYLSFYTTCSSDCAFPLSSGGSVYVSSLQHSSSAPRQPFLQNHGAPSPTNAQSATPGQLHSEQVVQPEHVCLNDIAAAGGCLSADGLSDSCTTDAPSGSNVAEWLLPRYPSDLESLWCNASEFHA